MILNKLLLIQMVYQDITIKDLFMFYYQLNLLQNKKLMLNLMH